MSERKKKEKEMEKGRKDEIKEVRIKERKEEKKGAGKK